MLEYFPSRIQSCIVREAFASQTMCVWILDATLCLIVREAFASRTMCAWILDATLCLIVREAFASRAMCVWILDATLCLTPQKVIYKIDAYCLSIRYHLSDIIFIILNICMYSCSTMYTHPATKCKIYGYIFPPQI